MPITALPTPPNRSNPNTFADDADTFLGALPTFATEANALQTDVNLKQSTATTAANTATTAASDASNYATTANDAATTAQNWATSLSVVSGGLYGARYYAQAAEAAVAALPDGTINDATTSTTSVWSSSKTNAELGNKQNTLVSGTTIKQINGESLLGSGNITIDTSDTSAGQSAVTGLTKKLQQIRVALPYGANGEFGLVGWHTLDSDRRVAVVATQHDGIYAAVFTVSTGVFGSWTLVRTGGVYGESQARTYLIDSTRVLVCSLPDGSATFNATVLSISGTSITVGTAAAATASQSVSQHVGFGCENKLASSGKTAGIVKIGSSYVVAVGTGANGRIEAIAMTVSGLTVTIGSFVTVVSTRSTDTSAPLLFEHDSSTAVLFYASFAMYGCGLTISGTTITVGTAHGSGGTLSAIAVSKLSSGRYAAIGLGGSSDSRFCIFTAETGFSTQTPAIGSLAAGFVGTKTVGNQVIAVTSLGVFVLTDSSGTAQLSSVLSKLGVPTPWVTNSRVIGQTTTSLWVYVSDGVSQAAVVEISISGNNPMVSSMHDAPLPTLTQAGGDRLPFFYQENAIYQSLLTGTKTMFSVDGPSTLTSDYQIRVGVNLEKLGTLTTITSSIANPSTVLKGHITKESTSIAVGVKNQTDSFLITRMELL